MAETLVEWQDGYSVNNRIIDEQHKELLRFTNELYAASKYGGFSERIFFARTVQKAVKYTQEHFSTEEKLMQEKNYPYYAEHKEQHDVFVAEVVRQIKEMENASGKGEAFVLFLKDWILNHIAVSDKKYMPYIADNVF
jgi:hemerythrin